nr:RNA-directed DNA polymerase, eukaryota [Tanacetum cinerariifolium]
MPDKDKVLSEDPFNLYDILNKRKDTGDDLKFPPSFTPSVTNAMEVNKKVEGDTSNEVNEHVNSTSNKLEESVPKGKFSSNNSVCSKRVHTSGSILQLMDELVKETKIESIKLVNIKTLWGNSFFDYALSSSLDTWKSLATVDSNGMINLKKKLQALKIVIKQWTKNAKKSSYKAKISIQSKLFDIDKILDQGDENTKFFHGILNNKCSQLAIRGTLVNDEWIVDPLAVKSVFLKYFPNQFSSFVSPRICFADQFTNRLSLEQQADLEQNVSNEEITSAVWDCGTNKSLGPAGFIFEFFRRYWKLLEHDIVDL